MARLGLRTAEVVSLRIADLDWNDSRVSVAGKGGIQGSLPLAQDVGDAIGDYIDTFYNPCRRHSAIDYASPIEFELKFMNEKINKRSA